MACNMLEGTLNDASSSVMLSEGAQEGGIADPQLIATVAYIMFDIRRARTPCKSY
jgi:hypothetical protein